MRELQLQVIHVTDSLVAAGVHAGPAKSVVLMGSMHADNSEYYKLDWTWGGMLRRFVTCCERETNYTANACNSPTKKCNS